MNSNELEQHTYNILKAIDSDPKVAALWSDSLPDVEMYDVLQYALSNGLLEGVHVKLNAHQEKILSVPAPRVTPRGHDFLQSFDSSQDA